MRSVVRVMLGFVLVSSTLVLAGGQQRGEQSPVLISPQTLLLGEEQGGSVVVHMEIPYSQVNSSTVALDGVQALWTKADLRGDLVAYFDEVAIKAIVAPPSATLTLTGNLHDGTPFAGSDTVQVKP